MFQAEELNRVISDFHLPDPSGRMESDETVFDELEDEEDVMRSVAAPLAESLLSSLLLCCVCFLVLTFPAPAQ